MDQENNWAKEVDSGALEGYVAPGFEAVADAFEENFKSSEELGASVCVIIGGETRIDLWGGTADPEQSKPWHRNTKSIVWSCTKGATSFCALLLASQGKLNIDSKVTKYWPEYGQNGKENTTIEMLLSHQSGVCTITDIIPDGGFYDWDLMVSLIENQVPQFKPGTGQGYQAMTHGWLLGEVVRRISGQSLGAFFREHLAEPLEADFWIGLPESEEKNCAPMIQPDPAGADLSHPFYQQGFQEGTLQWHLLANSGRHMAANENGEALFDTREAHQSEIGAAGGVANGRSLARLYAPLAENGKSNGRDFIDGDLLARIGATVAASAVDHTLLRPSRFSCGYMKSQDNRHQIHSDGESMILSESAFGHPGYGGSIGFADPEARMAFGYSMNRMGQGTGLNIRGQRLVDAVYRSIGYGSNESGRWRMQ